MLRVFQEEECPTDVDTPTVPSDHNFNVKIFDQDEILAEQIIDDESIGGHKPEPKLIRQVARPNIRRGIPFSRGSSPLIEERASLNPRQPEPVRHERENGGRERKSLVSELKQQRYFVPETTTQRRLRHRELLSHLHYKRSPTSSQDWMFNFGDLEEINLPHAQLVEEALIEILERYPCVERTCYHPIMRVGLPDEPDLTLAHSDDQSDWFVGSIDMLMKKLDLRELSFYPAVPIGLEAIENSIPTTPDVEVPPPISPTILSPPSQPTTPFWTMKTEAPWPDLGSINDDGMTAPTLANDTINNTTGEGSPSKTIARDRQRTHTIDSIDQVIKIKQDVEEWKNRQVEVETEGIRVMKALQERYRLEGKPWITAAGSGDDPVHVWVDEWNGERRAEGL